MKALVAVKKPYSEFSWTTPGELVWENPVVCCSSAYCGCNRALSGVDSLKNTTTAEVAELDIDDHDIFEQAAKTGRASKYGGEIVLACLKGAIKGAQQFDVGTIVQVKFEQDPGSEYGRWVYTAVDEKAMAET